MLNEKYAFIEKYIVLRQNNQELEPEELIKYFTKNGKIIDNVVNMKIYFGKKELLLYFQSSFPPWINPYVSETVLNSDGTFNVLLTFSILGFTIKTVSVNFKFASQELLLEQVTLN